jgi:hypothetical protein
MNNVKTLLKFKMDVLYLTLVHRRDTDHVTYASSARLTLSYQILSLYRHNSCQLVNIYNVVERHTLCVRTLSLGIITFKVRGGVTVGRRRRRSRSGLGASRLGIFLFVHLPSGLCFLRHLGREIFAGDLFMNHFWCRCVVSFVNFRRFSLWSQLCHCRGREKHKDGEDELNGLHG